MKFIKKEKGYVIFKCEVDEDYKKMLECIEPSKLASKPMYILEKILRELRLGRFSITLSRAIDLGLIEKI